MKIDSVTPKLDRLSLGLTTAAIGALKLQDTMEIVLPWIEGRKGWRVCRQREEERQKSWTASVSDRVMRLKLETEYVIVVVRGDAPGVGRELGEKGKSCRSGLCSFQQACWCRRQRASGRDRQDMSQDRNSEGQTI